jgi:hypothetical protein
MKISRQVRVFISSAFKGMYGLYKRALSIDEKVLDKDSSLKTFKNREVRVFISSSFRDMHKEREVLVKHVFPRLRQMCRARGVELTEIDLRWGLTEEQTQNMTDVVRVCLEEIDLCKEHPPFFISLLGELYGTVVKKAEFQALHNHKPDFEWLKNSKDASVTELEIIHAIFSRLERGSVSFDDLAKSTLFFMRDPDYIKSVPDSELANFKNDDTIDAQRALKKRIRKQGFRVTDYDNPEDLKNPVLRQLWHAINLRFPLSPTPLEQKTLDHEAFADSRTKIYIERSTERLDQHAASEDKPLVILGESGRRCWRTGHCAIGRATLKTWLFFTLSAVHQKPLIMSKCCAI